MRGPALTPTRPARGRPSRRYTFPHAKISTAPPVMNRVFGQTVDAQLQVGAGRGEGREGECEELGVLRPWPGHRCVRVLA